MVESYQKQKKVFLSICLTGVSLLILTLCFRTIPPLNDAISGKPEYMRWIANKVAASIATRYGNEAAVIVLSDEKTNCRQISDLNVPNPDNFYYVVSYSETAHSLCFITYVDLPKGWDEANSVTLYPGAGHNYGQKLTEPVRAVAVSQLQMVYPLAYLSLLHWRAKIDSSSFKRAADAKFERQQFYERPDRSNGDEPDEMTAVLGPKPPTKKLELTDIAERIALRPGNLLVINDEAHHTHEEDNEWNKVIRTLHTKTSLTAQLGFSATPRFQKGAIFPWTISDYPLKQAILHGIVKRPVKGIAKIEEAKSEHASVRYRAYLAAGVERWREYREQLKPLKKKPILFLMLNSTDEADDVAEWLRTKYPAEFGSNCTQVIHTKNNGEITETDLETARQAVREVDSDESPINAIVSVLMLREGWDVKNVTVVVGLRPYTAKANILPEQAIGRGLRLMFRDNPSGYTERVDIIGNKKFLEFVDDLEKLEEIKLDTFEIGKDKLRIITILPLEDKKEFDIGLPVLTPTLVRKKSLAEEIAGLDVNNFQSIVLPTSEDDPRSKTFTYEGYDIITLKNEFEREYTIPEPQTAQEVIGYYARRIAEAVKLPAQFAALAPKVREFFEQKAFGHTADLTEPAVVKAMSTAVAHYVCVDVFKKALQALTIEEQTPHLLEPARMLSSCQPFPWSRPVWEGEKCIFNLVPCDNDFEREFAKFLDNATDVVAFTKLPRAFGFTIEYTDTAMNLRNYEPDFVAVDKSGRHWLLESKGQENVDVLRKDVAAVRWCENASKLTGKQWKYVKVPQKDFGALQPTRLADLAALIPSMLSEVGR
jgi:type III restriction enzyme